MYIVELSKENLKEYRDMRCLVVADYSKVNYENDDNTTESKLADEYEFDFYPVIGMNELVLKVLEKYYGDYDVWLVDKSIIGMFVGCSSYSN